MTSVYPVSSRLSPFTAVYSSYPHKVFPYFPTAVHALYRRSIKVYGLYSILNHITTQRLSLECEMFVWTHCNLNFHSGFSWVQYESHFSSISWAQVRLQYYSLLYSSTYLYSFRQFLLWHARFSHACRDTVRFRQNFVGIHSGLDRILLG